MNDESDFNFINEEELEDDEVIAQIEQVTENWLENESALMAITSNFGIEMDQLQSYDMSVNYERTISIIWRLEALLLRRNIDETHPNGITYLTRLRALRFFIFRCYNFMMDMQHVERMHADHRMDNWPTKVPDSDIRAALGEESGFFTSLVRDVLMIIHKQGYYRRGNFVYKQIYTPEGNSTRHYEQYTSIDELIGTMTAYENNPDLFARVTHKETTMGSLLKYIKDHAHTNMFPVLKRNRGIFSFRNGIYFAHHDHFMLYGDRVPAFQGEEEIISAKYFDQDFDIEEYEKSYNEYLDIWSIKTKTLDRILKYQKLKTLKRNKKMIYLTILALFGRFIYDLGQYKNENWQLIATMVGLAGVGKSVIADGVLANLYCIEDVGVIGPEIQQTFGLEHVIDKFIVIMPDVTKDCQLKMGYMLSWACGEGTTIHRKYKEAIIIPKWKAPIGLSSNYPLEDIWPDRNGNMSRRLIQIRFMHLVTRPDPTLNEKLKGEFPRILLKINRAYRYLVDLTQARKLSNSQWLHEFFLKPQREMKKKGNTLNIFLESEHIEMKPSYYVPLSNIQDRFHHWRRMKELPRYYWDTLSTMEPYSRYKLTEAMGKKEWPIGSSQLVRRRWLIGCRLTNQDK